MDYYTLKTSVDLVAQPEAFRSVLFTVGFFSQPLIIGEPVKENDVFVMRFAVREETLRTFEDDVIVNLKRMPFGFTKKNTQLIRADRI